MNKEIPLIKIRGAAEHNLKNVNLDIPRNSFVVFTGENPPLLLIQSMQRVREDIWNRFPHMPDSSWDRWRSQKLKV